MKGVSLTVDIWKLLAYPRAAVVLVRDGIDVEFGDELGEFIRRSSRAHFPQRLGEHAGFSPNGHPQRTRGVAIAA